MAQLFFLGLMALILYFIADIVRKLLAYKYKNPQSVKPDVDIIDISEAWIDLNHLPYIPKVSALAERDLRLFELLTDVINKQAAVVIPKIHLEDILDLTPSASHRAEYARRLKERYVDFLICRRNDMAPLLLIVTESRGENEVHQQNREFVKRAAETVAFSLLTLNVNQPIVRSSLIDHLRKAGISTEIIDSQ